MNIKMSIRFLILAMGLPFLFSSCNKDDEPEYKPVEDVEYTLFDYVLYYDGYAGLVDEPVPQGLIRVSNSKYVTRISDDVLDNMSSTLEMNISVRAACDNYDRLGHVYLSFTEKGKEYKRNDLAGKIEVARIITPFMDKNKQPYTVPYRFDIDNIARLLTDDDMRAKYDFWMEFDIFGVPYAAQQQIEGCEGRIDTFYGTLTLTTTNQEPTAKRQILIPVATNVGFNNYQHTDVIGQTIREFYIDVEEDIRYARIYLLTSNHGANAGGEEYNRRNHYVYFDDELIDMYKPGGKSCEFFRKYNTQGNGIYSANPRSPEVWASFSNWCPGDKIPVRFYHLGDLEKGRHKFRIEVPDAEFVDNQGNIPLSVYIQGESAD